MSALMDELIVCEGCTDPRHSKRSVGLPKRFPQTLGHEHLERTLERHPWLEHHRLGALARVLRDAVVSNT